VHASKEAIEADDTVWFGTMLPLKGPTFGEPNLRAIDLARQDFEQMMAGYSKSTGEAHVRPFGVVSCDDTKDAMRAARHLVEEVHTPAVVGFRSGAELIDVGSALLVPNGVVAIASLTTSPVATSLPTAPGQPRLVWRTTYSSAESARAIGHVVPELVERGLRAKGALAKTASMRVALVREKARGGGAFDATIFDSLSFNGRPARDNGTSFQEFVIDDSEAVRGAERATALANIRAFEPHLIILIFGDTVGLVEELERTWPRVRRPYYVFQTSMGDPLLSWIGQSVERRHRFLGLTPMTSNSVNAQFVVHYNENAASKVVSSTAPSESYDAFYLLAYAAYAVGKGDIHGTDLARAIERLLPPGPKIEVGPASIFEAFTLLRNGAKIDLDGAASSLDFDTRSGEMRVDQAVVCAGVDRDGFARGVVDSGVVYRSADQRLVGDIHCP
jgi:hypothetical protein